MTIEACERSDVESKAMVEGALGRLEVGETDWVKGKVVCRWSADEFEVVSYGRRHFHLRDAATIIAD